MYFSTRRFCNVIYWTILLLQLSGEYSLNTDHGSPKTVITKEIAKSVEADLIICGATGHTPVERYLIGSVSEAIVRSAKCDVLVIRTPGSTI